MSIYNETWRERSRQLIGYIYLTVTENDQKQIEKIEIHQVNLRQNSNQQINSYFDLTLESPLAQIYYDQINHHPELERIYHEEVEFFDLDDH